MSHWPALHDLFDGETFETIAESPVSYVTRAAWKNRSKESSVAVKSASTRLEFSKQPHDILKELRLLRSLSHPNVIDVLGYTFEDATDSLHFWMPFIHHDLYTILALPHFSPHTLASTDGTPPHSADLFLVIAKSFMLQIICAVAFVHEHGIAHRDIKPRNLLVTADGCVKLIDFGVSWSAVPDDQDLWPEPPGSMCCDVASGPYRAPELLFGPTTYDAFATDLWSLGATLAEFFTPLRLQSRYVDEDVDDFEEETSESSQALPFIVPPGLDPSRGDVEWFRESLFDARRGALGLAWSVFQVRGTPTDETWPTFKDLPDAQKVTFVQVPPSDLRVRLPNMHWAVLPSESAALFDLIDTLLLYPPQSRLRADSARKHICFTDGLPAILPEGSPTDVYNTPHDITWNGKSLGDLVAEYLHGP